VSRHAAFVQCATTDDGAYLDARGLRDAIAALDECVTVVVVSEGDLDPATATALAGAQPPMATGRTGTDALKRVSGNRIIETLDRTRTYAARLPVVVPRKAASAWLAAQTSDTCLVTDLVTVGNELVPSLVDSEARLIFRRVT
jgi:2-C-methyl-D-erythritol 4-phosphate cytidylyltransferase